MFPGIGTGAVRGIKDWSRGTWGTASRILAVQRLHRCMGGHSSVESVVLDKLALAALLSTAGHTRLEKSTGVAWTCTHTVKATAAAYNYDDSQNYSDHANAHRGKMYVENIIRVALVFNVYRIFGFRGLTEILF